MALACPECSVAAGQEAQLGAAPCVWVTREAGEAEERPLPESIGPSPWSFWTGRREIVRDADLGKQRVDRPLD
jgi:hypothetical protein